MKRWKCNPAIYRRKNFSVVDQEEELAPPLRLSDYQMSSEEGA